MATTEIRPNVISSASTVDDMYDRRLARRKFVSNLMASMFVAATLISVGILSVIVFDIANEGIREIFNIDLLTRARELPVVNGNGVSMDALALEQARMVLALTFGALFTAVYGLLMVGARPMLRNSAQSIEKSFSDTLASLPGLAAGIIETTVAFVGSVFKMISKLLGTTLGLVVGLFIWAVLTLGFDASLGGLWQPAVSRVELSPIASGILLAFIMAPMLLRTLDATFKMMNGRGRNGKKPSAVSMQRVIVGSLVALVTVLSVSFVAYIVFELVREIAQITNWNFLTRARRFVPVDGSRIDPQQSGIAHAIQGTLIMTGTAALIAVPLGVLIAIYLSEFGRGRFADVLRFIVDLVLQMPSIVVGIFVWSTLVQIWGFSGRAGSVALAVIMTPIVVRSVEEVLRLVPQLLREAGWALGAPRWRVVLQIVVPTVLPGVITGVVLALARAAGESAPILLTALGSATMNNDLSRPMHSVPLLVYDYTAQPYNLEEKAWGAALVLIVIMGIVNAALRMSLGRRQFEN